MADEVGSVAVEVVPSTERFWTRFRQQTQTEGERAGEAAGRQVGDGLERGASRSADRLGMDIRERLQAALEHIPNIDLDADSSRASRRIAALRGELEEISNRDVEVRLSDTEARNELRRLEAALDIAGRMHPNITVSVNTGRAVAELGALSAAANRLGGGGGGFGGAAGAAGSGASAGGYALGAGIAAGITLIGPAAAVATAGLFNLGAAGSVALLAVRGIKQEMTAGTAVGQAFTGQVTGLKAAFDQLTKYATNGAAGGIFGGLKQLNAFATNPQLLKSVHQLGDSLGKAFNTSTGGLIEGFKVMLPLVNDLGHDLEGAANKFAQFTAGPEFRQFIQYARQELPIVAHTLADVASAAVHLAVAMQPIGDAFLRATDKVANFVTTVSKGVTAVEKFMSGPDTKKDNSFLSNLGSVLGGTDRSAKGSNGRPPPAPPPPVINAADVANTAALNAELSQTAARYGTTTGAVQAARAAIQAQTQATAAATLKMQEADNAAGLLEQAFNSLAGQNLSLSQAQTAYASAALSTTQALRQNGNTVSVNTQAGIANRQAIENQVSAMRNLTLAQTGGEISSVKATAAYEANRATMLRQIAATYGAKSAVYSLAAEISRVKPLVQTKFDMNTQAAKNKLASFRNDVQAARFAGTFQLDTSAAQRAIWNLQAQNNNVRAAAMRDAVGHATGGFIRGPGTTTSDSIVAKLSDQEFVVNAKATKENRALLEAINSGARFASGGYVSKTALAGGSKVYAAAPSSSAGVTAASLNTTNALLSDIRQALISNGQLVVKLDGRELRNAVQRADSKAARR